MIITEVHYTMCYCIMNSVMIITECKYNSALYNELLNDITECKYNSALYNEF